MTPTNICNLALAKIGDVAQVTSISPPDGSMQAAYCALFYSQALSVLLMRFAWSFALRVVKLNTLTATYSVSGTTLTAVMTGHGLLSGSLYNFMFSDASNTYDASGTGTAYLVTVLDVNTFTLTVATGGASSGTLSVSHPQWRNAFAIPADYFNLISVSNGLATHGCPSDNLADFAFEAYVLFCNWDTVVLEYPSNLVEINTTYPPLFVEALAVLLAAYLAGPMIKGDVGVAAAEKLGQLFELALKQAMEADGLLRRVRPVFVPAAIRAHAPGLGLLGGGGYPGGSFVGGVNNII